jgi:hypothetical protein
MRMVPEHSYWAAIRGSSDTSLPCLDLAWPQPPNISLDWYTYSAIFNEILDPAQLSRPTTDGRRPLLLRIGSRKTAKPRQPNPYLPQPSAWLTAIFIFFATAYSHFHIKEVYVARSRVLELARFPSCTFDPNPVSLDW